MTGCGPTLGETRACETGTAVSSHDATREVTVTGMPPAVTHRGVVPAHATYLPT
ncbi:predicted protein [Plenodomus lingam JN3]|uniref:Predicted protein n=1 Tax=Leptosphaeria maculans (strain JN3 / isolate v23.1.3 / race Av1-4-5-6-7-8) TaxID=985895 RepID=E4ZU09_LEPMJ|nr:predicted protein [Plenodomus lingam JN3]CBX94719.1 predicted protein [Plenodomus lingam JN3]